VAGDRLQQRLGGRYGIISMIDTDIDYKAIVEFIDEVGGLYFRSMLIPERGDVVQQHVHDHDHVTYVGNGSVVAFADDECLGEIMAGRAIEIKAGVQHKFVALEPKTRITCVHQVNSAESLKAKDL
jgi:quercetin dioxygenase-like cupin family protein